MSELRCFTQEGLTRFREWLATPSGTVVPSELITDPVLTETFGSEQLDLDRKFASRFEFGEYLNTVLAAREFRNMTAPDSDPFWAWVAAAYFSQLAAKGTRRSEHYLVTRSGSAGSLAYRQAARTSYELVHIHGKHAMLCLSVSMSTFGELSEQLASRQTIAHNKGFFQTAYELYVRDGRLIRGASSKPDKPRHRKPGDKKGLGSVRRLAVALQRLDLTFDTEEMDVAQMKGVLPKEFARLAAR